MKFSRIASAASFSILAALIGAQAHAEEYQGVLQAHSTLSRSDVRAQAVAAAHSADAYADGASSGVAAAPASPLDRSAVRSEARALAHAPGQNLYVEAFVNSRVPAQYGIHGVLPTRQAGISDGVTSR
ncbi:hypothetical protein EJO66_25575 [Variovorax beijingensis]|uniref:DUF4148 domain-containing protein n=1 Tax=Variovorax beijingensis TaxID=2496117 RepID=A0ABY0A010_9BURK|nr:hypothetical protein [Variovorax beijingensis]RSZ30803.1 hypothetical protein EJO66_25575 [Variovorax beijingensis]